MDINIEEAKERIMCFMAKQIEESEDGIRCQLRLLDDSWERGIPIEKNKVALQSILGHIYKYERYHHLLRIFGDPKVQ
jgi:hypothetical protein